MPALDARRKLLFAIALATLLAGAGATALTERPKPLAEPASIPRPHGEQPSARKGRRPTQSSSISAAARAAARFAHAYLRYQVGALGKLDREALSHFSTPRFGGELLRVPVRVPPGGRPLQERVLRVADIRVGLFAGEAALLASVLVGGRAGSYVLRTTLVKRGGRWLVTGIGP